MAVREDSVSVADGRQEMVGSDWLGKEECRLVGVVVNPIGFATEFFGAV